MQRHTDRLVGVILKAKSGAARLAFIGAVAFKRCAKHVDHVGNVVLQLHRSRSPSAIQITRE